MAAPIAGRADGLPAPRRVAVVLAGAGARGAYEAGVLSVLLPRLAAAGVVPSLYVGTSAGAINATLLAASAHLPAEQQADAALALWGRVRTGDVFRSPLWTGGGTAARWAGQLLRVPGARVTGLLDTSPLRALAEHAVDWDQLHRNLGPTPVPGVSRTLGVVTTSGRDNHTVVFASGQRQVPPPDDDRPIDYRAARIGPEHVLASAAIPVAFPPVWVPGDAERAGSGTTDGGWFLDGGVRLNAPLKPALALGADALVIVATHPVVDRAEGVAHTEAAEAPDVDDTLVRVMDAALVDRMVEDVKTLARTNLLVRAADQALGAPSLPYEVVPFLAVTPVERGTLAELATDVFSRAAGKVGGVRRLVRDPTMRLLGRLLDGDGSRRGDLMSYLYFDPEFAAAAIECGRRDATATLAGYPEGQVPWRLGLDAPAPVPQGRRHARGH
jgi:NTE family protein